MARVFAYCRVSPPALDAGSQLREIAAAGFGIEPRRTVVEAVSGSVPAAARSGFTSLVSRLAEGDVLVVTRLDRLGHSARDVTATVETLAGLGVQVHCLALGRVDLTSAAGRNTMGVLTAVADFERDLVVERTRSGLRRARADGRTLGRPRALDPAQARAAMERLAAGLSVSAVARQFRTSRQTIMRLRDDAADD